MDDREVAATTRRVWWMHSMRSVLTLAPGVALAILTLEGVSRWYYDVPTVRDPVLGFVVPAGRTVRSRIEGAGVAHYEDRGVRRSVDLGARTGAQILCLGDSFTEALQVSDDEVYTTLIERSLKRDGVPTAVLNLDRSGTSVADYIADSKAHKDRFAATWTVVEVDARDFTTDAWATAKSHFRQACPTCAIEVVKTGPRPEGPARRAYTWLTNRSALIGFTFFSWQTHLDVSRDGAARAKGGAASATSGRIGTFPVREELRMLADAYDGRLTVLLLGSFDPACPERETDLETAIRRAAGEFGISLARTRDEYAFMAERGVAPYGFPNTSLNSGHMNGAGHAAAARVLRKELLRLHGEGQL